MLNAGPSLGAAARSYIISAVATIYLRLQGEGVDVWRPVEAAREGDFLYRLGTLETPPQETWEFPPGSLVRCETRELDGGQALVAVALG